MGGHIYLEFFFLKRTNIEVEVGWLQALGFLCPYQFVGGGGLN